MKEQEMKVGEKLTGTVTSVGRNGFGFLKGSDGEEYFFHATALPQNQFESEVSVGTKVTFRPESTPKGPRALEVRIIRDGGME